MTDFMKLKRKSYNVTCYSHLVLGGVKVSCTFSIGAVEVSTIQAARIAEILYPELNIYHVEVKPCPEVHLAARTYKEPLKVVVCTTGLLPVNEPLKPEEMLLIYVNSSNDMLGMNVVYVEDKPEHDLYPVAMRRIQSRLGNPAKLGENLLYLSGKTFSLSSYLTVPGEYKEAFEKDLDGFIQDVAGISHGDPQRASPPH